MEQAKVKIAIPVFAYSRNGSIASLSAQVGIYLARLMAKLAKDPRVSETIMFDLCDTPITMTRNKAVQIAQENKCDFLFMIDSDMHPDYVPGAPPFWDVAFDFAYDRLLNNQRNCHCGSLLRPAYECIWSG